MALRKLKEELKKIAVEGDKVDKEMATSYLSELEKLDDGIIAIVTMKKLREICEASSVSFVNSGYVTYTYLDYGYGRVYFVNLTSIDQIWG